MTIKFIYSLIIFSLVFASPQSFARKPTVSSLNYAIKVISKQNNALRRELKAHKQALKKQDANLQNILQQQAQSNEQTNQKLQQLQQQLLVLQQKKPVKKDSNNLLYLLSALTAFVLGLSLLSLFSLRKKYQPEAEQLRSRINQTEADINKLSGQTAQQHHEVDSLKVTHNELFKGFSQKLNKLDYNRKQSYERRQAVEKELQTLLHLPITYEATEADRLIVSTMLEEGNLNFEETLQAKSLFAEYQNQWQLAIVYWETLLAENKNNTLALLHVAYGNYKLAEQNRKDEYYLTNATDTYGEIMRSAPEYFEDINAYDDDENMGASELVNDPDKVLIYQQIEKLVMKVDELKNYYSIYNLACQYAKEGDTEATQDWLEQISADSHMLHCKHLQQEQDLESVRDFPWFQDLIEASCEK
jgi:F0F1-type ATP synthase membrane subunit b/b'